MILKKAFLVLFSLSIATTLSARPGPYFYPAAHRYVRPPVRVHHHKPVPHHHHHHHHRHHHSSMFWSGVGVGFGVGLLGTVLNPPTPTVVVTEPVVQVQPTVIQAGRVWVPPVYGERPIFKAGIQVGVERYIITPGYYR